MSQSPDSLNDYLFLARRKFRPRLRVCKGFPTWLPLLNILTLLFFFYLCTSPFVLQPGVLVNLPESTFAAGARFGGLVVTITQDGLLFFNDERMTLDQLDVAFRRALLHQPENTLILEADRSVPFDVLTVIFNTAQRAGIRQVALATRPAASTSP